MRAQLSRERLNVIRRRESRGPFSIRVNHLPNLDRFVGELLPLVGRKEIQIARGKQMAVGFVCGLDRHIEKSREFLIRRRTASFGDVVLDAVDGSRQLSPEARVSRP